jgi:hypothetical protein
VHLAQTLAVVTLFAAVDRAGAVVLPIQQRNVRAAELLKAQAVLATEAQTDMLIAAPVNGALARG